MTEKEKCASGYLYDANNDAELLADRAACGRLLHQLNALPRCDERQVSILRRLLGGVGKRAVIVTPLWCDYGSNVFVGDDAFVNMGCTFLDEAPVRLGRRVFVGPNCSFYTALHPLDARQRAAGLEYASAIRIGDDVWLGGGVTILPGVEIGARTVIGAGSVVTRSVPAGVVAVGNPCRVVRPITEADVLPEGVKLTGQAACETAEKV